jgi:tRNA (guanine37-N1)-methyltransferase
MGNEGSTADDSFSGGLSGLLEAPAYTRPSTWRDLDVPPVLLSGDHAEIERWRRDMARQRTRQLRPDLLE